MVTNPQGRRGSPNVTNGGTARLLPGRRVSPRTRVGGGVALRPRTGAVGTGRLGRTDGVRRDEGSGVRQQKSRRSFGGSWDRSDYGVSGNYGHNGGNRLGINLQLGRQSNYDRHYYGNYGHDTHHYSHHDYGHYYGGLGHSFGGLYYPSYTYGYSNCYSPYYYGRRGYGVGLRLGGLSLGYSNYSYGYPGYFCSSSYYPSYDYYSSASYAPSDYGYWGYPAVYNPTYTEEYLEPVIYEEDLEEEVEEDGVLDEVEYDELDVDFYDPFGLSSDLSGYWIDDYTYTWPSWGWYQTFTLDPTIEPYYSGSYVVY